MILGRDWPVMSAIRTEVEPERILRVVHSPPHIVAASDWFSPVSLPA
jgi:hypothetical protein